MIFNLVFLLTIFVECLQCMWLCCKQKGCWYPTPTTCVHPGPQGPARTYILYKAFCSWCHTGTEYNVTAPGDTCRLSHYLLIFPLVFTEPIYCMCTIVYGTCFFMWTNYQSSQVQNIFICFYISIGTNNVGKYFHSHSINNKHIIIIIMGHLLNSVSSHLHISNRPWTVPQSGQSTIFAL